MAEVVSSMFSGVTFCCWIFVFHVVKPVMPILPFLSILCVREKPYCINTNLQKQFIQVFPQFSLNSMTSMNLKFGDVTERRSPTFSDCHYVEKTILVLIIAYFPCFLFFGTSLNIVCHL